MKRITSLVISLLLMLSLFTLTGCDNRSKEEIELENATKAAQDAAKAAKHAKEEYQKLQDDIDAYEKALEDLENAK